MPPAQSGPLEAERAEAEGRRAGHALNKHPGVQRPSDEASDAVSGARVRRTG
jgi:hypothetical protein